MTAFHGFLRLGLVLLTVTSFGQATTVLVSGGSWSTFAIDMDGNGQNDFVGVSTASSNLTGNFYSDRLGATVTGPTSGFNQYTGRWVSTATPGSVALNGTWTVSSLARTGENLLTTGFSFYSHLNQQSYYTLMVGNSGTSGETANLIAFFVDGRDYFANNANPIKFHYGVYGPITATTGSNTATVDYTNLAVPEPSALSLLLAGLGMLALARRWAGLVAGE